MNTWTFTGRIKTAERRATSGGKVVYTVTLEQAAKGERGRPSACRFQYWHDTCPAPGTPVVASGTFGGWQGQDGSLKMDLTAFEVYPVAVKSDTEQPQAAPEPRASGYPSRSDAETTDVQVPF